MIESISTSELTRTDSPLGIVLNYIFDGVYIVDQKMNILFWNKGAEAITGYKASDVLNHRCSDNILNHIDENGERLCGRLCPLAKTLVTGQPSTHKVFPKRVDNRRVPTMTHVAPIRNQSGAIIAAIEVFRDISKEEELRIMQEKFATQISRYVSDSTVSSVKAQIQDGENDTAQIRDLTILMLDIVGFTPFSEQHTPAEVVKMLNSVFKVCGKIVIECRGDIDKFIGDALLAVFVDANDAVAAAEKMLIALSELNRIRVAESEKAVEVRIGINSGLILQADIGTPERKDLTVIGDVVNVAERIQNEAIPQTYVISETTFARLNHTEQFRSGDSIHVKGRLQSVRVFHSQPKHNS